MAPLKKAGLLTDEPFDEPIDYTYFELWHHWGRTAKFGTWMQGPDYVQWHGIYEVLTIWRNCARWRPRNWRPPTNSVGGHAGGDPPQAGRDCSGLLFSRDQAMLLMAAVDEIFLGIDTYLAHLISGTIRPNEWIPVVFGLAAGGILFSPAC